MAPRIYAGPGFTVSALWLSQPAPGEWIAQAECSRLSAGAELFTDVEDYSNARAALVICGHCPVAEQCFAYGQSIGADGVWGGQLLARGSIRPTHPRRRRDVTHAAGSS